MTNATHPPLTLEAVKLLRIDSQKMINTLNTLLPRGRELSLVITHVEQARMLLGDLCRALGEPYPYTDGKYAPADYTEENFSFEPMPIDKMIQQLRIDLQAFHGAAKQWYHDSMRGGQPVTLTEEESLWGAAYEFRLATLWLGQVLAGVLRSLNPTEAPEPQPTR